MQWFICFETKSRIFKGAWLLFELNSENIYNFFLDVYNVYRMHFNALWIHVFECQSWIIKCDTELPILCYMYVNKTGHVLVYTLNFWYEIPRLKQTFNETNTRSLDSVYLFYHEELVCGLYLPETTLLPVNVTVVT